MDSVTWNYTFNPTRGVYNSIISTGKLDIILNDELRNRVGSLGDLTEDYLEEEIYLMNYSSKNLEPFVSRAYPLRPASFDRPKSEWDGLNEKQLFVARSMEYKNILKVIDAYLIGVLNEGPVLEKEYKELIELIDRELSK